MRLIFVIRKTVIFILPVALILLAACSDSGTGNNGDTPPNGETPSDSTGEITQTEVPDSMEIPTQAGTYNRELVKAWVSDPDGLDDVKSVYFYSRKPDGTLANDGDSLSMVDNGKSFSYSNPWVEAGDEQAGDGIYSLSILMFIDTQPGKYVFTFYMEDKGGNLSEAVKDSVIAWSPDAKK